MKKGLKVFGLVMLGMVLLGAVLVGIGCAVFFGSGRAEARKPDYVEGYAESEITPDTIDLDIGGKHEVVLQRGEKTSVKYFDSKLSEFTVTDTGDTLRIAEHRKGIRWWKELFYDEETTQVVITVPENAKFDLKGDFSGAVKMELPAGEYRNIDFSISGAGNISGSDLVTNDVTIRVSGASNVNLNGKFGKMTLKSSGAGNYKIAGFATELTAVTSGAGNMDLNSFLCPYINMECSGSSKVNMNGTGEELKLKVSGTTTIKGENFTLKKVTISCSGSSDATLNVSEYLYVSGSGTSKVRYYGNPKVESSGSGSFKLTQLD